MIEIEKLRFDKLSGLLPAIIVDNNTGSVLMLGFMNEESLKITLETKQVTFFSRTRNQLWTKGETSGNFLKLIDMKADCDLDTLLVYADPVGNVCHTGSYSCFDLQKEDFARSVSAPRTPAGSDFLYELFELIENRRKEMPSGSYTTKLFSAGENRIAQKVGEEAIETVIAVKNNDRTEIINESADLIYHLFVMLSSKDIKLSDVVETLARRHGSRQQTS